ncbi:homoserine dehydrogenase [Candidatus Saccharibacteria bacterium]|nr:homoserine dehydrogenase [Candidatus Saccharibacteria bacterium]
MVKEVFKYYLLHMGVGNVGRAVLQQVRDNRQWVQRTYGIDLIYCGLFDSQASVFNAQGLSLAQINAFPSSGIEDINRSIRLMPKPFALIDTTASEQILPLLAEAAARGGAVILANKNPLAAGQSDFKKLSKLAGRRLFYETTVGAGLPVIQTLKTLIATGDKIIRIEGCFSGTLGFIFSQLQKGDSLSEAVLQAKKLGFTEPDPRDDLSGLDVARKALILARTLGAHMEMTDIKIKKIYPRAMEKLSAGEFLNKLPELDSLFKAKINLARQRAKTLRFVAQVEHGDYRVGLREVDLNSDIGSLNGSDNIIIFKTRRYSKQPLVIKGPGAGVEVTAAGVFDDILQAAQQGAKL